MERYLAGKISIIDAKRDITGDDLENGYILTPANVRPYIKHAMYPEDVVGFPEPVHLFQFVDIRTGEIYYRHYIKMVELDITSNKRYLTIVGLTKLKELK